MGDEWGRREAAACAPERVSGSPDVACSFGRPVHLYVCAQAAPRQAIAARRTTAGDCELRTGKVRHAAVATDHADHTCGSFGWCMPSYWRSSCTFALARRAEWVSRGGPCARGYSWLSRVLSRAVYSLN
eukprot:scaffold4145_cov115-Isochrysis_galbana.AAC.14